MLQVCSLKYFDCWSHYCNLAIYHNKILFVLSVAFGNMNWIKYRRGMLMATQGVYCRCCSRGACWLPATHLRVCSYCRHFLGQNPRMWIYICLLVRIFYRAAKKMKVILSFFSAYFLLAPWYFVNHSPCSYFQEIMWNHVVGRLCLSQHKTQRHDSYLKNLAFDELQLDFNMKENLMLM